MAVKIKRRGNHRTSSGGLDVSMRDYQSAMVNNLTASWKGEYATAPQVIFRDLLTTRNRTREQAQNNDYAKYFLTLLKTNVVGPTGFDYRPNSRDPNGALDRLANTALREAFTQWSKARNADMRNQSSFLGLQRQFITNVATDGEILCRIYRGQNYGPYGYKLKMIDPGFLEINYNDTWAETGNRIEMSIEYDSDDVPVAYHILSPDLNGTTSLQAGYVQTGIRERVPAEDILHCFIAERIGQPRGMPWLATPLLRMNMQSGFEEAALVNARAGAGKMGFLKEVSDLTTIFEQDSQTGEIIDQSDPGSWHRLPPGVEPAEYNPTYPNNEFGEFNKAVLRGIAAGLGVAYHTLANDLEGVNYSSGRLGSQNERDVWMALQGWMSESFLQPIIDGWVEQQITLGTVRVGNGSLRASQLDKYQNYTLQGRRWRGVDPLKDSKERESDWALKIKSLSGMIRERGDDPETVWAEIAQDETRLEELGIEVTAGQMPGMAPTSNDDEEDVDGQSAQED